ncbi:MAG: ATP-binding protein [Roseovarius sp.]
MVPETDKRATVLDSTFDSETWVEVLQAVDKTYSELVEYQERLESQNAELLVLHQFLASIMASISDYLVVADKDGRIEDASRSFCEALGVKVDALAGRHIGDFFDGTDREAVLQAVERAIVQRVEQTLEAELQSSRGRDPVEFRVAPRLNRRGKRAGVVLTGRPLGELRRAYSELEDSHEVLKQTQGQLVRNEKLASLGRLLAGVAHELNNPISFVYANTHSLEKYLDRFETYFERVQSGASREELVALREELRLERDLRNLRTAIEGARDGAERVRSIVEDLRRLSAEGAGELAPFDLTDTARVASKWVERGTKRAVTVAFEGEERCMAIGRPGHIQQVVMNLVQNAIDAMDKEDVATVTLTLGYEGQQAVLTVRDSGPGIPEQVAQKIFDPFFTTKDVGKGTGLGLSISHKIAEEHGGELSLVAPVGEEGQGACFRLALKRGDHP